MLHKMYNHNSLCLFAGAKLLQVVSRILEKNSPLPMPSSADYLFRKNTGAAEQVRQGLMRECLPAGQGCPPAPASTAPPWAVCTYAEFSTYPLSVLPAQLNHEPFPLRWCGGQPFFFPQSTHSPAATWLARQYSSNLALLDTCCYCICRCCHPQSEEYLERPRGLPRAPPNPMTLQMSERMRVEAALSKTLRRGTYNKEAGNLTTPRAR